MGLYLLIASGLLLLILGFYSQCAFSDDMPENTGNIVFSERLWLRLKGRILFGEIILYEEFLIIHYFHSRFVIPFREIHEIQFFKKGLRISESRNSFLILYPVNAPELKEIMKNLLL